MLIDFSFSFFCTIYCGFVDMLTQYMGISYNDSASRTNKVKLFKSRNSNDNMAKNKLNSKIIIEKIEENSRDIRKYGVKKIGLFGSFLRKKQRKESDVDIIVSFDNITFDNYIELKFLLEKLFKKKVDLVIEKDLRPELNYVKRMVKYARL